MGLINLTVQVPSSGSPVGATDRPSPPRWRTLEFTVYYLIAAVVIPIMIWIPVELSSPAHPNYKFYESRLSNGWIFGRRVDNSDSQYRSFRNNLPILILTSCLFLAAKSIRNRFVSKLASGQHIISFNLVFSLIMLLVLHGTNVIKIGVIISVNYGIAKSCRDSKLGPWLAWIFNGLILLTSMLYHGYRFGDMLPALAFLDTQYQGIRSRWHIGFNITMLRLLSFTMDYYWACQKDQPETNTHELTEKQRRTAAHPQTTYSFINYVAYTLYPPLYIAGPIMTFNDYMWQLHRPVTIDFTLKRNYLFRFIITFFIMECILHFMYVVAIKDAKALTGETPAQISMIGFWNLIIVWLKLLLPWRFFRLWALMDNIDPPENMIRCMANNYSTLGFWRSWHRSYNLWIIRYIYVPLGGARNLILNTVLVFSFVAIWHDLSFRLLAWGWLISLFIMPELLARFLLPESQYGETPWYRHVCAVGAVLNVLMMMIANLTGFVVGLEGIHLLMAQLFGTLAGLRFLLFVCCCLYVGVQFMFEYREEEMRHGIYRRC